MSGYLLITVHWLDDRYHGVIGRGGPPEWPPSPFRLFQALVAGVARAGKLDTSAPSLRWLESLPAPMIIAPNSRPGQAATHFVPNNDGDRVPDRQGRLTGKKFQPTIMLGDPTLHYLWACQPAQEETQGVVAAARSLICLGLGVDMAFADARLVAEEQINSIPGIRWLPKSGTSDGGRTLRVPRVGSLDDILRSHQASLQRIGDDSSRPILSATERPRVFRGVLYTAPGFPLARPYQVFALRRVDGEFFPETQARLIHIAGMVRHAAIKAMDAKNGFPPPGVQDPKKWVDNFVAGHRNGRENHLQFSYVPLPSIGHEHADFGIRRVMIVAPNGHEADLQHLAEQLDGRELKREGGGEAPILEYLRGDGVTRQYTGSSKRWRTVTPVILPGCDDRKPAKAKKLLYAALRQSGVDQPCQFVWGPVPNFPNGLSAHSRDRQGRPIGYFRPDHLRRFTAVHACFEFENRQQGPLVIGAGRHYGFGLLAAVDDV